jgi:Fic family protein
MRRLSEADRALGELAGLGRLMPNPQLFVRPFIRREAVLSSRIEGTQTNLTELYVYEGRQLDRPKRNATTEESDAREVLNYVRAMEYGLERLNTLPVSLRLIRELHEQLMEGGRGGYANPGEFRRTQNWIGSPGCTLNSAVYVPPPIPEMLDALDAFEKYLYEENSYPPLVRLALIHYQFEAIHPFLDGNGRIGRLLISLLMVHWNLLPLPLLYLSAFFERHRQAYYEKLLAVSADGAWRDFLFFFLSGVTEQARDAIQRAKRLQDLQMEWRLKLQQARGSGFILGIVDFLFEQPMVSASAVKARFNVSHPAAMSALQRLEDMGILQEMTGKARSRAYLAKAILDIFEQ